MGHDGEVDIDLSGAPTPPFLVTSHVGPDVRTVYVSGDLDLSRHLEATAAFCDGLGLPIVVDLAQVDFMDCGGYRSIATARRAALRHGITLTIAHAHGEPARLLDLFERHGLA